MPAEEPAARSCISLRARAIPGRAQASTAIFRADESRPSAQPSHVGRSIEIRCIAQSSSGNGLLIWLELIIGTILADFFGFNIQQVKIEARWTGIGRTPAPWIGPTWDRWRRRIPDRNDFGTNVILRHLLRLPICHPPAVPSDYSKKVFGLVRASNVLMRFHLAAPLTISTLVKCFTSAWPRIDYSPRKMIFGGCNGCSCQSAHASDGHRDRCRYSSPDPDLLHGRAFIFAFIDELRA